MKEGLNEFWKGQIEADTEKIGFVDFFRYFKCVECKSMSLKKYICTIDPKDEPFGPLKRVIGSFTISRNTDRPIFVFFIINISTRFPVFCKALHIGWKYSWVQKDEYRLQKSTSIYIYKMVRLYKYIDAGHRLQNSMYMCIVYIQLCIYTMVTFRSTLSWCWPMVRGQSTKHPKVWTFHRGGGALWKDFAISCNIWKS